MSYQIVWSKKAYDTFLEQLDYLNEKWGKNIANRFRARVEYVLEVLANSPTRWPIYTEKKQLRKCVVHPNVSLFYKVNGRKIFLVMFHGNRQNPNKIIS